MKKKIKQFLILLMAIFFISGSTDLLVSKAQAEEMILIKEVKVSEGSEITFELPSAGSIVIESSRGYYRESNENYWFGEIEGVEAVHSGRKYRLPAGEYSVISYTRDRTIKIYFLKESSSSYEQEYNDTLDTANVIVPNNFYIFSGSSRGDDDYFKFDISSVGSLYIETVSPKKSNIEFIVYKEDENLNVTELLSGESGYGNTKNLSKKLRVSSGTYYLMLDVNETDYYSDCEFKVVYNLEASGSYEKEDNNTKENANIMLPNESYIGNIQSASDEDYYKITLPSYGKVKLRLQTPRQTEDKLFKVELVEENGGYLETIETIYSSTNPVVFGQEQFLKEGNYYIKVQNGSGNNYYGISDSSTHVDYNIQCTYEEIVVVQTIDLFCEQEELLIGDTTILTTEITPQNAPNKKLEWSSSNERVAKVNQNGMVTCVGAGQAIITAKATDGSNVSGQCTIVVSEKMLEEITVNLSEEMVSVGETVQAKAIVFPSDADNTSVTWVSSNPKVAQISSNGNIITLKAGKTSIKAIAEDGSGVVGTATLVVEKEESSDATLKSLSKTAGTWSKSFNPQRTSYTLTLSKNTKSTKITPKANDKYATVKINGKVAKSVTVKVSKGKSKTVKFKVTAENGKTKTYTVKVVRKK